MKTSKLFLILLVSMLFAACNSNSDAEGEANQTEVTSSENEAQSDDEITDEGGGIEVDKGLTNVEITFPSFLIDMEGFEDFEEELQDATDSDVTVNDDGTITVIMSKREHAEFLKELRSEFSSAVDDIVEDENFTTIQAIQYDDNFSKLQMFVTDQASFDNSFDGFVVIPLGMLGMIFQSFAGNDLTKDKVTIEVIDESTDEVIHEILYPDALEEMMEEE